MNRYDYATLAGKFEEYLSAHQPFGSPDTLYAPVRYINELGGKRIRPVLLLMAYNLWHDDITPALPAALAMEYFHNFSLMHDDIMDEAPLRRGKQTVHTLYGRNSAILSGDAMLIRCFDLLLEAGRPLEISSALASFMCKVSLEICEGQQLDMDFEAMDAPSASAYLEMIRKKTAVLLGGSLKMGAMLAGASQEDQTAIYIFGEMMGIGFQIQDDYLDVFGDANLTGKQQGGDILRGKKNFPFVHAYNALNGPGRKQFAKDYALVASNGDIQSILKIYDDLDIATYTQKVQAEYAEKGMNQLEAIGDVDKGALRQLAVKLMIRES